MRKIRVFTVVFRYYCQGDSFSIINYFIFLFIFFNLKTICIVYIQSGDNIDVFGQVVGYTIREKRTDSSY